MPKNKKKTISFAFRDKYFKKLVIFRSIYLCLMTVEIKVVTSRRDLKKYIHLPAKLHRDHKNWVPPLYIDEWQFYNPRKNRSFAHCDSVLALAYRNNHLVGRVMGIINHKYNSEHNTRDARFFNFECINDQEVTAALLDFIEQWAKQKGMTRVVGPLGFSDKDPQGLLIEGFDEPIVIATNCNFEYIVELVKNQNYKQSVDLFVYKLKVPEKIPDFYEEIRKRTLTRNNIRMLEFTTRRELRPYIKPVFHLVNETFQHIYGFSQIDPGEMDYMASRYLPVIDPKYVKLILDKDNRVVAFLLAIPDVAEGIRLARGRLFPLGLIRIIMASRRTRLLVMMLGAIKEEYRNYGLDALMGVRLLQEAQSGGMEVIDSHLVLETNTKMRAEYEKLGGYVYKKYRIFQKDLIV